MQRVKKTLAEGLAIETQAARNKTKIPFIRFLEMGLKGAIHTETMETILMKNYGRLSQTGLLANVLAEEVHVCLMQALDPAEGVD